MYRSSADGGEPVDEQQESGSGGSGGGTGSDPTPPAGDAYHVPVMVHEVVEAMEPASDGLVLDGTAGGGGHSHALLTRYPSLRLVAVDRDPEAMAALRLRLSPFADRVRLVQARFDDAAQEFLDRGEPLSGALLDLGISSRQIDASERGFTFRDDAPLDARMEMDSGEGLTAAEILNSWPEEELQLLFWRLAEEPRGRALARAVVARREKAPFVRAADLNEALASIYRRPVRAKEKARVYQGLRIQVNRELEALENALPTLRDALRPGGVLAVLSYHSLEDREVKNAFREWSRSCVCPPELLRCQCRGHALGSLVNRSVGRPSEAEVAANPRARSARFRVWRKAA
ncbi:MAG: 16S rRNA (cytosine(1402)-N(4))-methyltransferase RsmH [Gemmatimonadales bacterium]|nr:MAG: 16S rRNA (cytosine(1402)-N(4))-methyltransferase RsmH [Gemmatimonadales bacterium]